MAPTATWSDQSRDYQCFMPPGDDPSSEYQCFMSPSRDTRSLEPEKCIIGGQNEDSGKFHVPIRAARHR